MLIWGHLMKSTGATSVTVVGFSVRASLLFGVFFLCAGSSPLMAQQPQKSDATTQRPNEETAKREAWRKSMARHPLPKKGCFTASYPSTEWKEVPCSTAPLPLHPPQEGGGKGPAPNNVGGSN